MTTPSLRAGLCLLVTCLCVPALAQEGAPPAPAEGAPQPPRQEAGPAEKQPAPVVDPLLEALDLDRDGAISADELKKAATSLIALDKNKDGVLTREEFGPPGDRNPLAALDKDGDGRVSKAEADDRLKERFDELDKDRDGFLSAEELRPRPPAGPEGREAGGPGTPGEPRGRRGPGMRPGPISCIQVALDMNRDRKIDADEIKGAPDALAKLDKDKDGRIAGVELAPVRPASAFFARYDKDGDGKISKDEAPEHMKERFDALDMNGDGYIDQEDLDAFRQRYGAEPRGRGRVEGGGDKGQDDAK